MYLFDCFSCLTGCGTLQLRCCDEQRSAAETHFLPGNKISRNCPFGIFEKSPASFQQRHRSPQRINVRKVLLTHLVFSDLVQYFMNENKTMNNVTIVNYQAWPLISTKRCREMRTHSYVSDIGSSYGLNYSTIQCLT